MGKKKKQHQKQPADKAATEAEHPTPEVVQQPPPVEDSTTPAEAAAASVPVSEPAADTEMAVDEGTGHVPKAKRKKKPKRQKIEADAPGATAPVASAAASPEHSVGSPEPGAPVPESNILTPESATPVPESVTVTPEPAVSEPSVPEAGAAKRKRQRKKGQKGKQEAEEGKDGEKAEQATKEQPQAGKGKGKEMLPKEEVNKDLAQQFKEKIHIKTERASSYRLRPALRPDAGGTEGRRIQLYTNYYEIDWKLRGDIFHYDVDIQPACSVLISRQIIRHVVATHAMFNKFYPGYDGRKNLYTAKRLVFPNGKDIQETVEITLENESKASKFKVAIKFAAAIRSEVLQQHLKKKDSLINYLDSCVNSVMALDIILRQAKVDSKQFLPVGRSFFTDRPRVIDLGGGVAMWHGHYQSIRPGWQKLFLNVDLANKGFLKDISILELMDELGMDPRRELRPRDPKMLAEKIKGFKVKYAQGNKGKRCYRVNGVRQKPATQEMFDHEGTQMSVAQFFTKSYNVKLNYPHLPCLWVGSVQKRIYIPCETCTIVGGQQVRRLNPLQTAAMIKQTAVKPEERKQKINDAVKMSKFNENEYARQVEMSISDKMVQVEGRILDAPMIGYGDIKNPSSVAPRQGSWRTSRFVKPEPLMNWAFISFAQRFGNPQMEEFLRMVKNIAGDVGMRYEHPQPLHLNCKEDDCEKILTHLCRSDPNLKLIWVIMETDRKRAEDITRFYEIMKYVGDIKLGIITQGTKLATLMMPGGNRLKERGLDQTVTNLLLKVNSKLGGTNQIIHPKSRPPIFTKPVMFIGADVTHPPPSEKEKPSIAAVVASCDPYAARYLHKVQVQSSKLEIIKDFDVITKELLLGFYRATNNRHKPHNIIYFRDGVSEGQFPHVMNEELAYIQKACRELDPEYKPNLTMVVVQKRHHTRFFPMDQRDADYRTGNVVPGTVVEKTITHPTEFDYFLCSHQGIQGTSKPAHYHVLYDESKLSSDALQKLTYYLCHTFVRCTRSVSYPAPTYYAHLAAFRARAHLNRVQFEREMTGSVSSGSSNGEIPLHVAQEAIKLHENLQGMYFT